MEGRAASRSPFLGGPLEDLGLAGLSACAFCWEALKIFSKMRTPTRKVDVRSQETHRLTRI